jgi:hypothetical protein
MILSFNKPKLFASLTISALLLSSWDFEQKLFTYDL